MTAETQQGQPNGNAVAPKGVSFGYDPIGDMANEDTQSFAGGKVVKMGA